MESAEYRGRPACQPRGVKKLAVLQGPDVHSWAGGRGSELARVRNPKSRPRSQRPGPHGRSSHSCAHSAPTFLNHFRPWSPALLVAAWEHLSPETLHSIPIV